MATHGRPTPQPSQDGSDGAGRPRFQDRKPDDYRRADINPFLQAHAEFGPPLYTAEQAFGFRDDWDTAFGRKAPLHVELGSGNGFFLAEFARRHPEYNVLGLEIRYKRTVLCARKIVAAGVTNARMCRYHAAFLDDLFEPGTLSGLYVNHPDPWPKERHEKNRLISRWFLEDVASLLKPGGWFRLKSDFEDNIARVPTLLAADADGKPLPELPLKITGRSDDVITGDAPWENDIETNYQSKYRKRGEPVYAIELVRT